MSDTSPAGELAGTEIPEGGFQGPTGAVSELGDLPGDDNHPDDVPVADENAPLSQHDDTKEGPSS